MRASPVDLIGGYYKSDSLPWACQDTVNWLPVMAEVEGTRSLKMLETPPGLKPYQQIGTGPIRGMHDCEGIRLVVSGRYLYRITNAGVGVPIGVIPGVGRVSMTHNQFETGYQVLVENGQPGGGYVYNTVDLTFARITDEGYPGSISSDYLDSFLLGVEPFGRFWFHSDLASATSYNTLDRYEAEASPDKIVGLAVSGQEVVVFGQRTTEFFMNVGAATGTFQNRNTGFDRGCASRDTIAKLDNSIFWLGDDGIVYRLNGYAAQPVSTRALDQQLSRYNLAQAFAFVWEDRGHKVYYLTFPDGQTFGYDVVTGLWHRRESFGLSRWRLSHMVKWGGKQYGGDFQDGRLWLLDWYYFLEGAEPIISERVSPVLTDNQSRLGIPSAELVFDTGQGPGTVAAPFPDQPNPMTLSGDLPNGYVSDTGSMQYVAGGTPYAVSFSIVSGALPPGASMSSSGLVSYEYAESGEYAWVVRAVDEVGRMRRLADAAQVIPQPIVAAAELGARLIFGESADGFTRSLVSGITGSLVESRLGRLFHIGAGVGRVSVDEGETFVPMTGLPASAPAALLASPTAFFYMPAGNSRGPWKSTDGVSFESVNIDAEIQSWFSGCRSGDALLFGARGRVYRSVDGGTTWSHSVLSGMGLVRALAGNGKAVVAVDGNQLIGTFQRSGDNGATWAGVPSPLPAMIPASVACNGNTFVVAYTDGRTARSTDSGLTWQVGGRAGTSLGSVGPQNELVYAGKFLVASRNNAGPTYPMVYSSPDGIVWTPIYTDDYSEVMSITPLRGGI